MKAPRIGVLIATLALATSVVGGCYLGGEVEPITAADEADGYATSGDAGYEPMVYNGYVVYYDDYARPYCYINGSAWYVPATYPYYGAYVRHYYDYRGVYPHWYASYGWRYHYYNHGYYGHHGYQPGYHAAPGPHGSHGAPPSHGGPHH